MQDSFFHNVCESLDLGSLLDEVTRIEGGFMHKMFCLLTDKGKYALKLLNPMIMQRENVFKNYALAEKLENILLKNNISILPSLEFNGKKMQCLGNQYFYIFDFVNAVKLAGDEVKSYHCEVIGRILAEIHSIEFEEKADKSQDLKIDWIKYLMITEEIDSEIKDLLSSNVQSLENFQDKRNVAFKSLPKLISICNGDMDIKNVLWENDEPIIIDLESLSYGNPILEMFNLALSWSGYYDCSLDYSLLKSFIDSYFARNKMLDKSKIEWAVLYYSNSGLIEWLEYNLKRALLLECLDEDEQKLGISQVKGTLKLLNYYFEIKDELLTILA